MRHIILGWTTSRPNDIAVQQLQPNPSITSLVLRNDFGQYISAQGIQNGLPQYLLRIDSGQHIHQTKGIMLRFDTNRLRAGHVSIQYILFQGSCELTSRNKPRCTIPSLRTNRIRDSLRKANEEIDTTRLFVPGMSSYTHSTNAGLGLLVGFH